MNAETTGGYLSWHNGLPTKPDVDMLIKQWPEPKEGDRFSYDDIEAVLKIKKQSVRFRTITMQWRKRMLESRLVIECEVGQAFYVANTDQISGMTYGALEFIGRKAKKQRTKLSAARPRDEMQRAVIQHQGQLMHATERDAKKARMNLLPSTAAKPSIRIEPPKFEQQA